MGEPRIPVFISVGLWTASALAVLGFTYIAFKETANGAESGAMGLVAPGLVAAGDVLTAGLGPSQTPLQTLPEIQPHNVQPSFKPLERGKFK